MDKDTRNTLRNTVTSARRKLERAVIDVLEGRFGIYATGELEDERRMNHLTEEELEQRRVILAHLEHIKVGGFKPEVAVDQLKREIAFTHLNRLVAFKLMEQRGLIREAVSRGTKSRGVEFYLVDHPDDARLYDTGDQETAYRNFLTWQAQQFADEIMVLFAPSDPANVVYPPLLVLNEVLDLINSEELAGIWTEDETIGWVYQYFTPKELRDQARSESAAPRNSYELAFRNQFYTPRYVVEFLSENTLGRTWYEMRQGDTVITEHCDYLVRRPNEVFLAEGVEAPEKEDTAHQSQEDLLQQPAYIPYRPLKDPRSLRVLDPACGSGHFLLYAFDLLAEIYEEAWQRDLQDEVTGQSSLRADYETLDDLRRDIPRSILQHNLYGIDIDRRATQIAALALWLRAQRYYNDHDMGRDSRPPITQGNIVVAEPMPGERKMLDEFAATLNPPLLGQLVKRVFSKMQLAGEAGSLLKIEEALQEDIAEAKRLWEKEPEPEQLELFPGMRETQARQLELFDVSDIDDVEFWQQAEKLVLKALENYAEKAANGLGLQRRLFADDAVEGFSFIDVMQRRFDAALMNPPFGASSKTTEDYISANYPNCNKNLFAAFVINSLDHIVPNGSVGAITDRAFVLKYSYKSYREQLYEVNSPVYMADLGWEVLDTANVETTAYIADKAQNTHGIFVNLLDIDPTEKADKLAEVITKIRSENGSNKFNIVPLRIFQNLPHNAMSHFVPPPLHRLFISSEQLEPFWGDAKRGMSSGKTAFACRLLWEVDPRDLGQKEDWNPVNVGGGEAAFSRSEFMCFYYRPDWGKLNEFPGFSLKNVEYFWKVGIGWGKRTENLTTQLIPRGQITAEDGQVFVPHNEADLWFLLGILNSRYAQATINTICGIHKGPGYIGKVPVPKELRNVAEIESLAKELYMYADAKCYSDETSLKFRLPLRLKYKNSSPSQIIKTLKQEEVDAQQKYQKLDLSVLENLFPKADDINAIVRIAPKRKPIRSVPTNSKLVREALSYYIGSVYGRWDIRYALDQNTLPPLPHPFKVLPECSPGMLRDEEGLPATETPKDYPLEIAWDGILTDDPDHPDDIINQIRDILHLLWVGRAYEIEQEMLEILDEKSLRYYFRKSGNTGFFMQHVRRYSKSRRKAPIYWYLQSNSKNYGLWLYYHRLDSDLLYKALTNYVRPKVQQVQHRMEDLRALASEDKSVQAEFEEMEDFYLELVDFRDKLQRAADLNLQPDLNDGVVLNIAPLHELVPWKYAERYWKRLLKGKYEWSSISQQLRERGLVEPK